jgi:GNAT superfamily N-acetyltransferase
MSDFSVRPVRPDDRDWVRRLMREHWAAEFAVVHGETFYPERLPGFIAESGGERAGLATYAIGGEDCEIVTLNSLKPGRGIGGALIRAVGAEARRAGCRRLFLVTTNDNLPALRFYQRIGFAITAVRPNAVAETRKRKPVPEFGIDGIPIRDEIELELAVGPGGNEGSADIAGNDASGD